MSNHEKPGTQRAGAFDVRTFVGLLLGIFGVILVLTGLFATSDADKHKAGGTNIDLWTGLALAAVSIFFATWARLRPVIVPVDPAATDDHD